MDRKTEIKLFTLTIIAGMIASIVAPFILVLSIANHRYPIPDETAIGKRYLSINSIEVRKDEPKQQK